MASSYVVCDIISNILLSESLIENFRALAQMIATVYQYYAKLDQPKKKKNLSMSLLLNSYRTMEIFYHYSENWDKQKNKNKITK